MGLIYQFVCSRAFKKTVRWLTQRTGVHVQIKKLRPNVCLPLRHVLLLKDHGVDTVIDVGANTGQFSQGLYDFGFIGRVISFEPVEEVHAKLCEVAKRYPGWEVYKRCAVGDSDSTVRVNVSDNSVFSSILDIKGEHVRSKPMSKVVRSETVSVFKLDGILSHMPEVDLSRTLLKVDTQGFERQVVSGAREVIKGVKGIKIEIPLFSIYKDTEWKFEQILDYLMGEGFYPYSIETEGVDETTGRVNTIDGVFFRQ